MLILICSPVPRNGKDSVADRIVREFNYKKFALADPIKEIAHKYFDIDELPKTKRRNYYIGIGEYFRTLDKDVWLKATSEKLEMCGYKNVVISDMRMMHEYEWFKKYDPVVIGIESQVYGDFSRSTEKTQIDYWKIPKDFAIENNGTIEELYSEIDEIILGLQK